MTSFVSLDIETANSSRASICSIGLVKFIDGKKVDSFYSLINPEEKFSSRNIKIHKIEPEDVLNSPTFPEIRPEILSFIDDLPVVAHNAGFDMYALKEVYIKYQLNFDLINYLCSYQISKAALPNLENHKLKNLSDYFDITLEHHNALSDAEACGILLLKLMEQEQETNIKRFLKKLGYENLGLLGEHGFIKKRASTYTNSSTVKSNQPNTIKHPSKREEPAKLNKAITDIFLKIVGIRK